MTYFDKYSQSHNHTRDDFRMVLVTSILVNFSILLTAIPFLKPVMDGLQTGILASDLRSMGGSAFLRSSSYPLGSLGRSSKNENRDPPSMWRKGKNLGYSVTAASGRAKSQSEMSDERMIIQSTTVSVQYGEAA